MTDTPLNRQPGTASDERTIGQQLEQLRDKIFWGNVLAGVVASFVFYLLTLATGKIVEVFEKVSAGFTFATGVTVALFIALIGINIRQTYGHTKNKKAMGAQAFIILQVVFGIVGVSLVILMLTVAASAGASS